MAACEWCVTQNNVSAEKALIEKTDSLSLVLHKVSMDVTIQFHGLNCMLHWLKQHQKGVPQ